MCLQLQYGRLYVHVFRQIHKTRRATCNRWPAPCHSGGLLHCTVSPVVIAERLVDEQQVDIIRSPTCGEPVDAACSLFLSGIGNPNLGGSGTVRCAARRICSQRPLRLFIVISLRRVYQTITPADSLQHAAFALFGADEIHAVARNRHFHAVIQ